mmetsp:Transcript_22433/g.48989  ORF Transcript_22433/g.48989 Transcript_22433/m.48989 type:complete len:223 (+) Transcript_22433:396-1064(+)
MDSSSFSRRLRPTRIGTPLGDVKRRPFQPGARFFGLLVDLSSPSGGSSTVVFNFIFLKPFRILPCNARSSSPSSRANSTSARHASSWENTLSLFSISARTTAEPRRSRLARVKAASACSFGEEKFFRSKFKITVSPPRSQSSTTAVVASDGIRYKLDVTSVAHFPRACASAAAAASFSREARFRFSASMAASKAASSCFSYTPMPATYACVHLEHAGGMRKD